jgi:hypothetical protein
MGSCAAPHQPHCSESRGLASGATSRPRSSRHGCARRHHERVATVQRVQQLESHGGLELSHGPARHQLRLLRQQVDEALGVVAELAVAVHDEREELDTLLDRLLVVLLPPACLVSLARADQRCTTRASEQI